MSFDILIISVPDRDMLVAEIWWNDQMVAEMRLGADGHRYIDLYPSPSRTPWSFRLEEWLVATKEGRKPVRLIRQNAMSRRRLRVKG